MNLANTDVPGIPEEPQERSKFGAPSIPGWIHDVVPSILKRVCSVGKKHFQKDILLLSSLAVLSGCMPWIYGIYNRRKVYSNLYCYVVAPPASGKAWIELSQNLAYPIHEMLRTNSLLAMAEAVCDDDSSGECAVVQADGAGVVGGNNPQKVGNKGESVPELLVIPANCSSAGFYELMQNNKNGSIIVETEGSILSQTFKSSFGNFRTCLLKAFHHEVYQSYRKTNHDWIYIPNPRLSVVISSTPPQVRQLIPTDEDGLGSRFMFYGFDMDPTFEDVFSKGKVDSEEFVKGLGAEVLDFYKLLKQVQREVPFSLTEKQEELFSAKYEAWTKKFSVLSGVNSLAIVFRLGLAHFRICMTLTALRNLGVGTAPQSLVCSDVDFNIASEIIDTIKEHNFRVFETLIPRKKDVGEAGSLYGVTRAFFDSLPDEFDKKTALERANGTISERTVARILASDVFVKVSHGQYRKIKHV